MRPELSDDVLDPEWLLARIAGIEDARARSPHEHRVAQQHYDEIKTDLTTQGRATPRASRPRSDDSRPPAVIYLARHAKVSQFQSVITHCVESNLRVDELTEKLQPGEHRLEAWWESVRDLFRSYGPCDVRWLEPRLAHALDDLIHHKHPFPDQRPQPVTLASRARVLVVGDWATGLKQAQNVARAIREHLDPGLECHVVHLGDTYYSGFPEEYQHRFLPFWPVDQGSGARSWSLNGNHDMYSGGYGYFDLLLKDPRFDAQGGSSYFCLRNAHWQLIGLDSSYKDPDVPDLAGSQPHWLRELVADNGIGTILLSHHQPFSAYETVDTPLAGTIASALAGRRVEAWLWGHEHGCAVYKPGVRWKAYDDLAEYTAMIGHGGVPQLISGPEAGTPEAVDRAALDWEFTGRYTVQDDSWLLGGFAVLDFDGRTLDIQYYDETNNPRGRGADRLEPSNARSTDPTPRAIA